MSDEREYFNRFKKFCIVVILCLVGSSLIKSGIEKNNFYNENINNIASVTATVSRIQETEDSDGDRMYRIFVTYTYDGKTYENVHLFNDGEDSDEEIGDEHEIKIFANYPDMIATAQNVTGISNFILGGISLVGAVLVGFARNRNRIECNETIKKEIYTEIWHGKKVAVYKMIFGGGFIVATLICVKELFYIVGGVIVGVYILYDGIKEFGKFSEKKKLMDENKF